MYQHIWKTQREQSEKKLAQIEKLLKQYPKGKLTVQKNGDGAKYFWRYDDQREYISAYDVGFAETLAKKGYLEAMYQDALAEKQILDVAIRKADKDCSNLAKYLSNQVRRDLLVEGGFLSDKTAEEWAQEWYPTNPWHPENLKIKTLSGRKVRSKSEAMILHSLMQHGLSFRYECELILDGIVLYPDFMIMHPVTHKIILWEHLGMLDSDAYLNDCFNKLRLYFQNGYIPSVNLILTYESGAHPLDIMEVERQIQHMFEEAI